MFYNYIILTLSSILYTETGTGHSSVCLINNTLYQLDKTKKLVVTYEISFYFLTNSMSQH